MPAKEKVVLSLAATFFTLAVFSTVQAVSSNTTQTDGDLVSPQIILATQKPPVFPPAALAARFSGTVMIEITVLPDGKVGEARVLDCTRRKVGFEDAALAAVKKWRFEPGRKGDQPVEFTMKFRLNFQREGVGLDRKPRVTAGSFSSAAADISAESPSDSTSTR